MSSPANLDAAGRIGMLIADIAQKLIQVQQETATALADASPAHRAGQDYPGHRDQAFGHISYAQHGEDMILVNWFHLLRIAEPTWLDLGAHHPTTISNTALLYARGGHGVNVEANPNLLPAFARERPRDRNLNIGVGPKRGYLDFFMVDDHSGRNTFDRAAAEAFVAAHPEFSIRKVIEIPVVTVDDIVREHCGGVYPDLLSIDVEGLDEAILAGADFSYSSPKIICVETINASGNNSTAIRDLLLGRGYVVGAKTTGNYLFVRADLEVLYR